MYDAGNTNMIAFI